MTGSVAASLDSACERLGQGQTDTPRLDAEVLLGHVLGRGRAWLLSHPEFPVGEAAAKSFHALIAERGAGRPVAYLTGKREFWSLDLRVTPDVLIPRPETEILVEKALDCLAGGETVLDLGTGSGAIALAIASERPGVALTAVDRSPAAIAIARGNAERLGIHNVTFLVSDWFSAVGDRIFDLVVANPPYVDAGDDHLQGEVRYEPVQALVADDGGFADLAVIISRCGDFLRPGGYLLVEHGYGQSRRVADMFVAAGFEDVECLPDLAGLPRITHGIFGARNTTSSIGSGEDPET